MGLSLGTFARVFACIRTLFLAAAACFAVATPAAAQLQVERLTPIPGPVWGGWENLEQSTCTQAQQAAGTCFASNSAPDCVTVGANRLDCFTRVYGGVVARRQWDGQTWQPWNLLSNMAMDSYYASAPECVAWDAGRIDCFISRNGDGVPHQFTVAGGSGAPSWEDRGGVLTSDAECLSPQTGRLYCIGRGTDGALHQNMLVGAGWSGWNGPGGQAGEQIQVSTKPSCVTLGARIVCVFVTPSLQLRELSVSLNGTNPAYRNVTSGTFSAQDVGADGNQPSPKCVVNGEIHCFVPATNGGAFLLAWLSSNGTSPWTLRDAGSTFVGAAHRYDWDCVARQSNRIDCMELVIQATRSPRGGGWRPSRVLLRHGVLTPSASSSSWGDAALNTAPTEYPAFLDCLSWGADRIDCFASGGHDANALWHAWFAPPPPRPTLINPNRPPPVFRPPSN